MHCLLTLNLPLYSASMHCIKSRIAEDRPKIKPHVLHHQNFPGTFKSTNGDAILYIGDPLADGTFNDNENRGYKIRIQKLEINVWPYNTNQKSRF